MSKSTSISDSFGIICTEVFDEASSPSAEEINKFAKKIGVDPNVEGHLLPLVKEGLMKPLPKHWKPICEESTGAFYYYNSITKQTQWEHPMDEECRQRVQEERNRVKDTHALDAKNQKTEFNLKKESANKVADVKARALNLLSQKSDSKNKFEQNPPKVIDLSLPTTKHGILDKSFGLRINSNASLNDGLFRQEPRRRLGKFSETNLNQKSCLRDNIEEESLSKKTDLEERKNVRFDLDENLDIKFSISDSDSRGSKVSLNVTEMNRENNLANSTDSTENSDSPVKYDFDFVKNVKITINDKEKLVENNATFDNNKTQQPGDNINAFNSEIQRSDRFINPRHKFAKLGAIGANKSEHVIDSNQEIGDNSSLLQKKLTLFEKLSANSTNESEIRKIENLSPISKLGSKENSKPQSVESANAKKLATAENLSKNSNIGKSESLITANPALTNLPQRNKSLLYFSKMTDGMKSKPLSIESDTDSDSLLKYVNKFGKQNKMIMPKTGLKIVTNSSNQENSSQKRATPLKALPIESDDSTGFDISINLSISETADNRKSSNDKDLTSEENITEQRISEKSKSLNNKRMTDEILEVQDKIKDNPVKFDGNFAPEIPISNYHNEKENTKGVSIVKNDSKVVSTPIFEKIVNPRTEDENQVQNMFISRNKFPNTNTAINIRNDDLEKLTEINKGSKERIVSSEVSEVSNKLPKEIDQENICVKSESCSISAPNNNFATIKRNKNNKRLLQNPTNFENEDLSLLKSDGSEPHTSKTSSGTDTSIQKQEILNKEDIIAENSDVMDELLKAENFGKHELKLQKSESRSNSNMSIHLLYETEKSHELSKTSSDTSVESQILSKMYTLTNKDISQLSQKPSKEISTQTNFENSNSTPKVSSEIQTMVHIHTNEKIIQTIHHDSECKFTQTIDFNFEEYKLKEEQLRKENKKIENKYKNLKIKYNKIKRKLDESNQNDNKNQQTGSYITDDNTNCSSSFAFTNSYSHSIVSDNSNFNFPSPNPHRISNNNAYENNSIFSVPTDNLKSSYSCIESLKNNLRKIDAMIELMPAHPFETTYFKYPFAGDFQTDDSTDINYIKHRLHIEHESVGKTKSALKLEEEKIRNKQRSVNQSAARKSLDQLAQEQDEITDAQINLHRSKSLLNEKVIRLRHIQDSLNRLTIAHKKKRFPPQRASHFNEMYDTLSDISSHSSGFSSTDVTSDHKISTRRKKLPSSYKESELQKSLENINSEIQGLRNDMNKQTQNVVKVMPSVPASMVLYPEMFLTTNRTPVITSSPLNSLASRAQDHSESGQFTNVYMSNQNLEGPRITWEDGIQMVRDWLSRPRDSGIEEVNAIVQKYRDKERQREHSRKQSI